MSWGNTHGWHSGELTPLEDMPTTVIQTVQGFREMLDTERAQMARHQAHIRALMGQLDELERLMTREAGELATLSHTWYRVEELALLPHAARHGTKIQLLRSMEQTSQRMEHMRAQSVHLLRTIALHQRAIRALQRVGVSISA